MVKTDTNSSKNSGELFLGDVAGLSFVKVLEDDLEQDPLGFDHVLDVSKGIVKMSFFIIIKKLCNQTFVDFITGLLRVWLMLSRAWP